MVGADGGRLHRGRSRSHPGGELYADYMIAPVETLAREPEDLSSINAVPLTYTGVTTFSALRNSGAGPARQWRCWPWVGSVISGCSLRQSSVRRRLTTEN
jgi:D-arabinose 1-dehydrogenase-like Zn-dependent alcohol dehydrogenase